jgi:dephospho-CoA kinase
MKAVLTIGFTGTIASGKSSRCRRLVEVAKEHQRRLDTGLKAAHVISNKPTRNVASPITNCVLVHYINADLVGHNIYEPGKPCYHDLVHHFGSSILSRTDVPVSPGVTSAAANTRSEPPLQEHDVRPIHPTTSAPPPPPPLLPRIDRCVLGEIVFGSEHKLQELNAICWPYISAAIRTEHAAVCARATASPLPSGSNASVPPSPPASKCAEAAATSAVALIIIEAALLCDMTDVLSLTTDLWMTHCTPATAVNRLIERNGLTPEAAQRRVASQREIGETLQTLRELSYKGDIEVFDTTQVSLAEGLKETEKAFEKYWQKKVLMHHPQNPSA